MNWEAFRELTAVHNQSIVMQTSNTHTCMCGYTIRICMYVYGIYVYAIRHINCYMRNMHAYGTSSTRTDYNCKAHVRI